MVTRLIQVDAFTDRPFRGNPAAVCLLDVERSAAWMQQVALEMNLSETAFVLLRGDHFSLRWFTPAVEVDLCGHATLAAAHALWEQKIIDHHAEIVFATRSGRLTARRRSSLIELDFPATPATEQPPPAGLLEALGIRSKVRVGKNTDDFLVHVNHEEDVRRLQPDFNRLRQVEPHRGVIVTARADDPQFDFVSRFFAPQAGVNEDPVTGSAHCCLGPFWSELLAKKELTAQQISSRGGVVRVRIQGPRVVLGGSAVTVLIGELLR